MKRLVGYARKLRNWARRHKILATFVVVLAVISLTSIIIITRTYHTLQRADRPMLTRGTPILEIQTEGFTCGMHALVTVYKAYGFDPVEERVRWRLGVDTKALFWLSDSTGVLHPDMYTVFVQDFFQVRFIPPDSPEAWSTLCAHLQGGHMAVLLIRRRQNDHLHWVVAADAIDDAIVVYDSLVEASYSEERDFLTNHIVSLMLVQPTTHGEMMMSSADARAEGGNELLRAQKRIEALRKLASDIERDAEENGVLAEPRER